MQQDKTVLFDKQAGSAFLQTPLQGLMTATILLVQNKRGSKSM